MLRSVKFILTLEAFFSGFYVTITRNFFILMLAYTGYDLRLISYVMVFSALLSLLISYTIYGKVHVLTRRAHIKLIITHGLERILWLVLPYLVGTTYLLMTVYALAISITIPVGILINMVLYTQFKEQELVDVVSKRFAFGSVSSIIGGIFGVFMINILTGISGYITLYLIAGLVGLTSTVILLFSKVPRDVEDVKIEEKDVEIEFRRVNVFTFLFLLSAGVNILAIAWIPYLKSIGAKSDVASFIGLAFAIGGVLGSYLWKTVHMCRLALMMGTMLVMTIPFITIIHAHPVLAVLLSSVNIGGYILANIIYSKYVTRIGIVKTSTLLTSGYAAGLLLSSILGITINNYLILFTIAALLFLTATSVTSIAIPESAMIPTEKSLQYARVVYSASIIGYSVMILVSKESIMLILKVLALTLIIIILYVIYRILILLLTI